MSDFKRFTPFGRLMVPGIKEVGLLPLFLCEGWRWYGEDFVIKDRLKMAWIWDAKTRRNFFSTH